MAWLGTPWAAASRPTRLPAVYLPVMQAPRAYTTIEVAKRLGVSLQTVQRCVDAGHLKAWKTLGGHRRIEAAGAELLFKQQEGRIGTVAPVQAVGAGAAAAAALRAVVVNDDPHDLALLVTLVQQALPEAAVEAAANGFQGLLAIGKAAPQIVITDIHMPHMNGFEMIRTLLDGVEVRPRTLIAISALRAPGLAAVDSLPPEAQVFTKPLDRQRFVPALRRAHAPFPLVMGVQP